MTKILALGTGPLLEKGVRNFSAHCLRTWHLVQPLLSEGHEVQLYTLPIYSDEPEIQEKPGVEQKEFEGFKYRAFRNCDDAFNLKILNEAAASFASGALLGINSYPCFLLSGVSCAAPLWADLNGWLMVEAQVKAAAQGHDSMLAHYWKIEEAPLRRADFFSTVSTRQKYALMGELAVMGRLNRRTFNYPFASAIPNAFNPLFVTPIGPPGKREQTERKLRGTAVPDEAFILLWSGGYNTWTNVDILYDAVALAMRERPSIHYVSTGGAIYGHDDLSYAAFRQRVNAGPYKDRFHMLGWIDALDLPQIYAEADLGLCVDGQNSETTFGARNRTINMMAAGLPVLTTRGAEISDELVDHGVALGCDSNDARGIADGILKACNQRDTFRAFGASGTEYILKHFSYRETTKPLVEWMRDPRPAPDREDSPIPLVILLQSESAPARLAVTPGSSGNHVTNLKRLARGVLGDAAWSKLVALRHRTALAQPDPCGTETLNIRLTRAKPEESSPDDALARIQDIPGELTLKDWQRIAPTLPNIAALLFEGEPLLHPQCREIIGLLAQKTQAKCVSIESSGMFSVKLESLCASLVEGGCVQGLLIARIGIHGMEQTLNAAIGNSRAWSYLHHTLGLLRNLESHYPGRFELHLNMSLNERNFAEFEEMRRHFKPYLSESPSR